MALKLGRDEVRWAWSPCIPGREGWNAAAGVSRKCLPQRGQHCVAVYSDNSTEVVSTVDSMQGGCWGGVGIGIPLGGKGGGRYEGLECRA